MFVRYIGPIAFGVVDILAYLSENYIAVGIFSVVLFVMWLGEYGQAVKDNKLECYHDEETFEQIKTALDKAAGNDVD